MKHKLLLLLFTANWMAIGNCQTLTKRLLAPSQPNYNYPAHNCPQTKKTRKINERLISYKSEIINLSKFVTYDSVFLKYNGTNGNHLIWENKSLISYFDIFNITSSLQRAFKYEFDNFDYDTLITFQRYDNILQFDNIRANQFTTYPIVNKISLLNYDSVSKKSYPAYLYNFDLDTSNRILARYDGVADSNTNLIKDTFFKYKYNYNTTGKLTEYEIFERIKGKLLAVYKEKYGYNNNGEFNSVRTYVSYDTNTTNYIQNTKDTVLYFTDLFFIYKQGYDTVTNQFLPPYSKIAYQTHDNHLTSMYNCVLNWVDTTWIGIATKIDSFEYNSLGNLIKFSNGYNNFNAPEAIYEYIRPNGVDVDTFIFSLPNYPSNQYFFANRNSNGNLTFIYDSTWFGNSTPDIRNHFFNYEIYNDGIFPQKINELVSQELLIYPNPANSLIQVSNVKGKIVSLYNMQGQIIFLQNVVNQQAQFTIANLPKGLYFIKSDVQNAKVIVE